MLTQYFAPVDGRHLRRHRRDEHDRSAERGVLPRAVEHVARDRLRQEVRSLQVRAEHLLEAVLGGLEEIGAHARRAPGVVDERVERAMPRTRLVDDSRSSGGFGRCRPRHRRPTLHACLQFPYDGRHVRHGPEAAQEQIPAAARQRARDPEADATRAAGDERRPPRRAVRVAPFVLVIRHESGARRMPDTVGPRARR